MDVPARPTFRETLRLIREDFGAHGRVLSKPGFQAVAVYRLGRWTLGFTGVRRAILNHVYLLAHVFIRNIYGIELRRNTKVGRRFVVGHQSGIVIHPRSVIGDDCLVRQNVTIGAVSLSRIREAPILEDGVEVGAGAVIIGKVTIGAGARIGPNVVVTTDIPPGALVVASPPRIIQPPHLGVVPQQDTMRRRDAS